MLEKKLSNEDQEERLDKAMVLRERKKRVFFVESLKKLKFIICIDAK